MAVYSVVCEYSVWVIDSVWIDVWCMAGNHPAGTMLVSWKSNTFAVSCSHAVAVDACTIFGKPNPMGNICPEAAAAIEARASTSNAPAIALFIDLTIPFDYHGKSRMSVI